MSILVIFIGDWSLYMKPLRDLEYIKMYTGLWSKDRTIQYDTPITHSETQVSDRLGMSEG